MKDKTIFCFQPDFDYEERAAIMQHIATDRFITAHRHVNEFEKEFARHHNRRHAVMVNSGSSAVLIAVASMPWDIGAKIITPAVTFATTLSPILNYNMKPIFVDVEPGTYNIDYDKMLSTMKNVDGVMGAVIPHTLGNPVDPRIWKEFAWSVEDACDALDSTIDGKMCGTFGSVSVFSFFPAHHITTGQGGMALTDYPDVGKTLYQMAAWGRACWCRAGDDGKCGNRFDHDLDGVDYDHKYIFDLPGYNLAPLDLCGVLGKIQLAKAEKYRKIRTRNFKIIDDALRPLEDILIPPRSLPGALPNWFAYPITLKKGNRRDIQVRIHKRGVDTRLVFGGNITRQPMFKSREVIAPCGLAESDRVLEKAFMVGCNHTLSEEDCHTIAKVVKEEVTR